MRSYWLTIGVEYQETRTGGAIVNRPDEGFIGTRLFLSVSVKTRLETSMQLYHVEAGFELFEVLLVWLKW